MTDLEKYRRKPASNFWACRYMAMAGAVNAPVQASPLLVYPASKITTSALAPPAHCTSHGCGIMRQPVASYPGQMPVLKHSRQPAHGRRYRIITVLCNISIVVSHFLCHYRPTLLVGGCGGKSGKKPIFWHHYDRRHASPASASFGASHSGHVLLALGNTQQDFPGSFHNLPTTQDRLSLHRE